MASGRMLEQPLRQTLPVGPKLGQLGSTNVHQLLSDSGQSPLEAAVLHCPDNGVNVWISCGGRTCPSCIGGPRRLPAHPLSRNLEPTANLKTPRGTTSWEGENEQDFSQFWGAKK